MDATTSKILIIGAGIVTSVLGVCGFLPALSGATDVLSAAILLAGLITAGLGWALPAPQATATARAAPAAAPEPEKAPETSRPEIGKIPGQGGELQVASLLALLQEKGRFLDFVMDDITRYSDAQVSAAARVVHQGCQSVLKGHFEFTRIAPVEEGRSTTLEAGFSQTDYKLSGRLEGDAPFTGTVVHQGWKTTAINLPKLTGKRAEAAGGHVIAPAEIEVK